MKTAKIMDGVGYKGVSGVTVSDEKYFAELKRNGYDVKHTKKGVVITKNNGEPEFESVSLFSHVNESRTIGTSWHGANVKASVRELTGIIGEPSCATNDGRDKVNFEWCMETANGDVFTIYDWKEYRVLDLDEPIEWHIGCHTSWIGASVSNLIMAELMRREV